MPFGLLRASGHFLSGLLDLVLPPRCVACDALVAAGSAFCAVCEVALVAPEQPCPRCAEPGGRRRCSRCRALRPAFARLHAPWLYGGPLADAIGRLKYEHRTELAGPLARLWSVAPLRELALDRVLPVPLHRRRLAQRGYNQAALLARPLARALKRPLECGALSRRRDTPSQTRLGLAERRANVHGAFAVPRPSRVEGQRLLLVDDVATTGSTLDAAARVLLAHGAVSVVAVVLARAELRSPA
ncbi:MAG: phosphoribosyltransferase [Proteobacteria bacterium]|nr:MAG: phosphoribosyltransferase [Pseudomonadota bacterium]